ncbi:MAG: 6-carboxytetrahydropterin synthase [Thermomicrobiaceae bacterium]|nr:6-carboxytetrahydropterin synthase [Thermomicrobiaceae bacterium]
MYGIGIVAQFEAAHHLHGDFGPASRLHGHTYRVEVEVSGVELRPDGTLFDVGRLREAVDAVLAPLNYQNLDDLPAFAGRNTTAEEVARHLRDALISHLRGEDLSAITVRVWESPLVYAVCSGDIG